jgi:uncharacterized protein YdeI (YjbR/CyaY-like superfamily)
MNSTVDAYMAGTKTWREEQTKLRAIVLDCQLSEELKWGQPCYTFEDRNIVLIHVFKEYAALLFFKGALLKDTKGILVQQTKNVQAARQLRFTSAEQIVKMEKTISAYIHEAVKVEMSGLKVALKETAEFDMPDEFKSKLKALPALKKAFEALTPGRQRAYLLHFADAKQAKTREARIDKYIPGILAGKGLKD